MGLLFKDIEDQGNSSILGVSEEEFTEKHGTGMNAQGRPRWGQHGEHG